MLPTGRWHIALVVLTHERIRDQISCPISSSTSGSFTSPGTAVIINGMVAGRYNYKLFAFPNIISNVMLNS